MEVETFATDFSDALLKDLLILHEACEEKVAEISAAIKQAAEEGLGPTEKVQKLQAELSALHMSSSRMLAKTQRAYGISEELLEALEQEELPRIDQRFWLQDVEATPSGGDLDQLAARGLERLLSIVDRNWLRQQPREQYRLGQVYISNPVHLVGGMRITVRPPAPVQRFAQMLLVCEDHLNKRPDLDFFTAAMLVPEVGMLGYGLDQMNSLGPEAGRKLANLHQMTYSEVASTVYELLVGAACVRRGLQLRMITPNRRTKTPDYRVLNLGVPAAIECKRRQEHSSYEISEARHIETLYDSIKPLLVEGGHHVSINVTFSVEVESVGREEFQRAVTAVIERAELEQQTEPWGVLSYVVLPYTGEMPRTRLYSPAFVDAAFKFRQGEESWDGLLGEVDEPPDILVRRFKNPRCLRWKSISPTAQLKKARGITSLWADAVRQLPDGELGFVYIAYVEGDRAEVADARTRHILDTCNAWHHRWSVTVPMTVINRIYPRTQDEGKPDLIESSLPAVGKGHEHFLGRFPSLVFVPDTTKSVQ